MKKIKVYIASPYTIGDKEENVKKQIDCAEDLMNLGFVPFIPLLTHYQHQYHPRTYEEWMEYDFEWLSSCDCVLRLDGESLGADREVKFAKNKGMPVFYSIKDAVNYFKEK